MLSKWRCWLMIGLTWEWIFWARGVAFWMGNQPVEGPLIVCNTKHNSETSSLKWDSNPVTLECHPWNQNDTRFCATGHLYDSIQCDSFGTRPKKMRISQRLFIWFWTCIYDDIRCFMKSMSILVCRSLTSWRHRDNDLRLAPCRAQPCHWVVR